MKSWLLALGAAALGVSAVGLARRSKPLGRTVRKGPRTESIEIDDREVDRVLRKLVRKFKRTNDDVYEACPAGMVRPYQSKVTGVQIRQPNGEVKTVNVDVMPSSTREGGAYASRGHLVRLYAANRVCASPEQWQDQMRSTLRHEFTHVADPLIDILESRGHPGTSAVYDRHGACAYVNDPLEINARLAQVRGELMRQRHWLEFDKERGQPLTTTTMRLNSPTFEALEKSKCLTPANRRRFLKVAARVRDAI